MTGPLPSWNDGSAKQAIVTFIKETTIKGGSKFEAPEERIAAFDQDGTTWVEQPAYTRVLFAFNQLGVLAAKDHLSSHRASAGQIATLNPCLIFFSRCNPWLLSANFSSARTLQC